MPPAVFTQQCRADGAFYRCDRGQCGACISALHGSFIFSFCFVRTLFEVLKKYTSFTALHCCILLYVLAWCAAIKCSTSVWMGHIGNNFFLCVPVVIDVLQCSKAFVTTYTVNMPSDYGVFIHLLSCLSYSLFFSFSNYYSVCIIPWILFTS